MSDIGTGPDLRPGGIVGRSAIDPDGGYAYMSDIRTGPDLRPGEIVGL